jgi:hypothetical protein
MIFGDPANITTNYISSILEAGLEYKDIAVNINDLSSRIIPTLDRF